MGERFDLRSPADSVTLIVMNNSADGDGATSQGRSPDAARPPRRLPVSSPPEGGATIHALPLRPTGAAGRGPAPGGAGRGLFPSDSITWQVHSDPLMGVAALRGLFLHTLHPVAMGALDARKTEWDPWQRLARTAHYVGVYTFGTASDAMLAGSRLRAVHAQIHGTTRAGRPYAAEDPGLLGWVHNCLVASFLEIVTRGGMSLSAAEQDTYIAEQVRAAMLVGLEPDEVPRDRTALRDYFRRARGALVVTPAARTAVTQALLPEPPSAGTGQRPPWAAVAGLAFSALPPWARRMYALPQLTEAADLDDTATTVALRRLRTTLEGQPWAHPPHHGGRAHRHPPDGPQRTGGGRRFTPPP